ncbi:dihydroorotate dehydrogenase B (NAD(+)), electron transfer subunit [Lactococcus garvieae]|jgi:dihydroorotate dehydrogenase electron transfer subunit|nr:dihydroorotate dehydrogenase electron transfer subunit [Lactococcus garvieae]NHI68915.1 dihydroorotate dehydrogenase electron transfer subunit [Lactococcus garvieae]NHJ07473.1 dihydroorotate dehydrogenase electron transfer subunit [Lactococcus garvieae]BDM75721.1 dihydroorotate dehydrogenase B (NAD(+)), electron transfer subunit [Lactococcus garvieae]BDW50990.1 dihydroorotate dehydrogenase B (NAD(+)), electron transfer subunit [Lactococcus garvieae]
MKLQEEMLIVSQKEVAEDIFELVLQGDLVDDMEIAGQFLQLKVPSQDLLLRRPISISSWNKQEKTCTLLYRRGDKTTGTYLLSKMSAGQAVDILGPLGKGFPVDEVTENDQVLIVGGGIGVPPLYELAKQLSKKGCTITVLLGFSRAEVKILEEQFAQLPNVEVKVATDNGSYGCRGHVGHLFNQLEQEVDAVYACGAPMMLKAVATRFETLERLYLSMEARMACGIGACYACVVPDKKDPEHALKVCQDGPVFKGNGVVI